MAIYNKNLIKSMKGGAIAVIPTDTIYGLIGSALNQETVERIYKARKRNPKSPFIILISSLEDLKLFGIKINSQIKRILENIWPDKISVILPCENKKFSYLHRGKHTLAFRMPAKKDLLNLLKETGPLVAPSANLEGMEPAKTITEAKKYFGAHVDFYISAGKMESLPSTLVEIKNGKVKILREGSISINVL